MFRTRSGGGGMLAADASQDSPIFVQFLDAVWQVNIYLEIVSICTMLVYITVYSPSLSNFCKSLHRCGVNFHRNFNLDKNYCSCSYSATTVVSRRIFATTMMLSRGRTSTSCFKSMKTRRDGGNQPVWVKRKKKSRLSQAATFHLSRRRPRDVPALSVVVC